MIYIVTTFTHRNTHEAVERARRDLRRMPYPLLLSRRRLPRGAYVFTDFDRLGFWQLELAAHVYRVLEAAGCRVLNDPARALHRLAFLRRLHRAGINSFQAWPATEAIDVDRFPVFVRTESAHRGPLTDLIDDPPALAARLERLLQEGYPIADLIVVEFRAKPLAGDIFRKLSVFRVGDALVPGPSVHERHWTAKLGQDGIAGEDGYASDLELVRKNPYANVIGRAFATASIEYGRADFGVVDGRPEVYEINTNPMMHALADHPIPDRAEAIRLSHAAYHRALDSIASPLNGSSVAVPRAAPLRTGRKRLLPFPGYQWLP